MGLIRTALLRGVSVLVGEGPVPGQTVLDDDFVSQTFPLLPDLARRSLAPMGNVGGWFLAVLENVHSGADFEQSNIGVYAPAAAAIVPPYPVNVSKDFDIWLLGCSLIRSSGAGGLTYGRLGVNPSQESQGLGIDDAGASVLATPIMGLARFTSIDGSLSGIAAGDGITDAGLVYQPINMRLSRRAGLVFSSEAGAAAEFQMLCVMGIFPAGLGQDVVT